MRLNVRPFAIALAAAISLGAALGAATPANAELLHISMVLDWKYQRPQGLFFLAKDRGYFKKAGLDVTMDDGNGSGAAVPLVANGTYDVGFGNINALIQFVAVHPGKAPLAVYVVYNQPLFTIAARSDSNIKTPKELEGKTLGDRRPTVCSSFFRAFCKIAKINRKTIKITNMQPSLREQMLTKMQVGGVFGYINTTRFSAILIEVNLAKLIRFTKYGDHGMDLHSNSIIVSRKLANDHPRAATGLIAATNHGLKNARKDPMAAIDAVVERSPLINKPIELNRLEAMLQQEMNSPEIAKIGLGNVGMARQKKSVEFLVDAENEPRTPAASEFYTAKFTPPVSDLPKKLFYK